MDKDGFKSSLLSSPGRLRPDRTWFPLNEKQCGVLDESLYMVQEKGGCGAIDDPVI